MNANELADELEDALDTDSWCQECALETTKPIARQAATMLRQQQTEINQQNEEKKALYNLIVEQDKKIIDLAFKLAYAERGNEVEKVQKK
jgi:hypothetical protein